MANFTALKTAINNAIKTNGNEEITGAILQAILDAMVETLGDSAINDLENAITTEVTNRENAVGGVADDLAAEVQARQALDYNVNNRINAEEYNRQNADAALSQTMSQGFLTLGSQMTALNAAISALNAAYQNGYLYGGIATPSSSPSNNKCFYIALQGGTYTNFGGVGVVEGINIIKNDSGWKVEHIYDQTTLLNEFYLLRQQVIQAITSFAPIVIEGDVTNAPDEEDLTSNANHLLQFKNNAYSPLEFSGLGRKYLRKNIAPLSESAPFNGFVEGVTAEETLLGTPTHIFWDRMNTRFVGIKDGIYYAAWTDDDNYVPVSTSLVYMYNGTPYQWTGSDFIVDETEVPNLVNCLTQDMINEANTIYIIRYDYTLKEDITIPANCVLQFDGGSISGEFTLTGANTCIEAGLVKIFDTDITLAGTWNVEKVFADWFEVSYNGTDESELLQNAIEQANNMGRALHINGNIKCDTDIIVYSHRGLIGEKYSNINGNIVFEDTIHNAQNQLILGNLYANNITLKCLGFAKIRFIRCINFIITPTNNSDGFGFNTLDDIFCSETFTIDLSNGWCNDNIFNKICANVASAERYGLRIEGNNGVTKAFHNNFFNACDFSHNKGVYSESLEKNTFTGLYIEDATINGVHINPELNGRWNILGIARYNNSNTVYENSRDTLVLTSNSRTPQYIPIGTNILKQGDFSYIRWNDKLAYKISDNSAIGDLSIRNDSPTKVAYRITGTGFDFKIPIGKIRSNSLYVTLITKTTDWIEAFSIQADEDVTPKVYFVGADKDYDGYKIFTAAIDTLGNTDFNKNWYIRGTCSGNKIIDIAYIGVSESSIIYPTIGRELVYDSYIQGSGDIAAGSYLDVSIASLSNDIQVEDIDIVVNAWPDSTNYVGLDKCIKKIIRTLDTEHNTTTYKVRFENNTAGAIWAQFTGWAKIHILREYTRY